ncbi:CRISPR type III-b/ramp module-associated protein cmr3 [Eggerthia catenaformis OT 569 = DSM 20559]|uniref:CRISPR type III-b/ramp module-associated protein cmr3 n=1 Tax=Eggerthia catenaformis OT 569 = DSM 20559 TaxID=999415 RepID=M2PM90_9FIRM|nr:type III-B CRISPR module-associated Cmr3 family protein [Eggerthia catenaformis]EMD16679.1 CRISPR type III-b/ramp module-associated protein cmr3 [Eggerthia catenaformis OT 569 = DSM 20559]
MAIYKVLFHPLEEYFFGEDGSFREGVSNAEYFITSRFFPSQTTVFGIIRYLNLLCLKDKGSYSQEEKELNNKTVGEKGFSIESAVSSNSEVQNFGIIKRMSSIFLHGYDLEDKVNRVYVTLPKDAKKHSKKDVRRYTSILDEGKEMIMTPNGGKVIPSGYNAKKGLATGFISIDAGISDAGELLQNELSVIEYPFEYVLKTGLKINRKVAKSKDMMDLTNPQDPMSSLFKKEYVRLKQESGEVEYSFGVYVEIENSEEEEVTKRMNRVVGMGLGGSLFSVRTSKIKEIEKKRLKNGLILNVDQIFENHVKKENILYCISPCYVSNPQDILMKSEFASLDTVVNRPMNGGNIDDAWRKTKTLYRMMDSGSVLITKRVNEIIKEFQKNGLQQIGYNHYYLGGEI